MLQAALLRLKFRPLRFYRARSKRQTAGALQDASAIPCDAELAVASWTAVVLYRFVGCGIHLRLKFRPSTLLAGEIASAGKSEEYSPSWPVRSREKPPRKQGGFTISHSNR